MKVVYWIHAIRPKTLLASVSPVLIGLSKSYVDNDMGLNRIDIAILTFVCAILIQIGSNIANDLFDFINGADTNERVGPLRVAQSGLLSSNELTFGIIIVFSISIFIGTYLFIESGSIYIILIGIFSLIMAILYTGGPYPLGYMGLGDVMVLIFFGIVPVQGTYLLQLNSWSGSGIIFGIAIGSLATSILVVNNLRDIHTDMKAGKRTLAVIFGKKFALAEYIFLQLISYFIITWTVYNSVSYYKYPILLISVFMLLYLVKEILTRQDNELNKVLSITSMYCFIYSVMISVLLVCS